jgi:16S rRNA (guanine1207-N2)-methyltransferase
MSRSRLSALLEATDLPPGGVVALRPPAAYDLAALPRERTRIVHGFRPDRDAWAEAGWQVADEVGPAGTVLVVVPRSKRLAQALVAEAAGAGAPLVLVDGQRDHGIDSLWRDLRERCPEAEALTQGHGRLIRLEGGPDLARAVADWAMPVPSAGADGLYTQPGVFGEGGADRASLLLADALPARLPARMADFGAGVGTLARAALAREGVEAIDLIEAEALALDCARLNVPDARARFVWADATRGAFGPFDGVVMNPPFHQGRAPDPALGRAFIAAAARALAPQGQLWMVANRHLPYEAALAEAFRDVELLGAGGGFKLIRAGHPKAAPKVARASAAREVVRTRRAR